MIITKLRRLNAILKALGQKGCTLKLDFSTPITYEAVRKAYITLANRSIDVRYEVANPLELTFVTYEEEMKVWTQKKRETEFAVITFGSAMEEKLVKTKPEGGQIEVTEEFVDLALKKVEDDIREVYRKNIIDEMVEARLKERGLV